MLPQWAGLPSTGMALWRGSYMYSGSTLLRNSAIPQGPRDAIQSIGAIGQGHRPGHLDTVTICRHQVANKTPGGKIVRGFSTGIFQREFLLVARNTGWVVYLFFVWRFCSNWSLVRFSLGRVLLDTRGLFSNLEPKMGHPKMGQRMRY